jgi:hypothetical protein
MGDFGLTVAGEFSNAITDCGLYVTGIGMGTRYEGTYNGGGGQKFGDCAQWTDYQNFDSAMKKGLKAFNMASMDALQVSLLSSLLPLLDLSLSPYSFISPFSTTPFFPLL